MLTAEEIRHQNFVLLLDTQCGGVLARMAEKLSKQPAYIHHMRNQTVHSSTGKPRELGKDVAREIEAAFGLERGWMDHEHNAAELVLGKDASFAVTPFPARSTPTIPESLDRLLMAARELGEDDRDVVGTVLRALVKSPDDQQKRNMALMLLARDLESVVSTSEAPSGGASHG